MKFTQILRKMNTHSPQFDPSIYSNSIYSQNQHCLFLNQIILEQLQNQKRQRVYFEKQIHQLKMEMESQKKIFSQKIQKYQGAMVSMVRQLQVQNKNSIEFIKHRQLAFEENIVVNFAQINEVRWISFGPELTKSESSFTFVVELKKINWIALGFSDTNALNQRKLEGLNAKSEHGSHVVDCFGWVHSHKNSEKDYTQSNFKLGEGDIVEIRYDSERKIVKLENKIVHESNFEEKSKMRLCMACSKQCFVKLRISNEDQFQIL